MNYPNWYWIVIVICFLFSMFFSCADMAYSAVDKDKLKRKAKHSKNAKIAYDLATDYEISISTVLFGNNVANILASSLITIIGGAVWGESWGPFVATVIFTAVLILCSEFLPKAVGKRFSLQLAIAFAYPTLFFKYLFIIFVWPVSKLFKLIGKIFKKKSIEEDIINDDVLTEMVDTVEENGLLEENEADLVRNSIDIHDTKAFEIMTPRVDMVAIDAHATNMREYAEEGEIFTYSRVPVYEDTIDNIVGILPIKEAVRKKLRGQEFDLLSLCYEPLFIPRNYPVIELLKDFKRTKIHIAVVIDEYGGTEGIITMEDILEEIVGDIFDESDDIEEEFVETREGTFIVDGSMNLDDFFEMIEYDKEFETEYTTVGGFCQEILERFAKTGDKFIFDDTYECIVLEADEYTVEKLQVRKIKKEEDD